MKPSHVLSIDPGLAGALALLDVQTKSIVSISDMPVTDGRVDPARLAQIIDQMQFQSNRSLHAVVENVNSRPRQAGMWAFALSVGTIHGVLGALGVPFSLVQPAQWKSAYGLRRAAEESQASTKARAREIASRLWPERAADFKRVMDSDRAEAALIARFWVSKNGWL